MKCFLTTSFIFFLLKVLELILLTDFSAPTKRRIDVIKVMVKVPLAADSKIY